MISSTDRLVRCAAIGFAGMLWLMSAAPSLADVDPLLVDRARAEIAAGEAAAGFARVRAAIDDPATPDASRADLYGALAALHLARGEFADAAAALTEQARLIARLRGASAPELAGLYSRAAEAYSAAGNHEAALAAAQDAARIDVRYYDCASDVLAEDHARLADSLAALGRDGLAAAERRAAEGPPEARCSGKRAGADHMPVVVATDLGDADPNRFARVKVFFATDRARSGSHRPDDFYGSGRGDMDYGTLEVTVPRIHKPGAIESPSIVKLEWTANPERHFVISRVAATSEDGMLADLKATLAKRQSDEIFVFVHGYNVSFAKAAKRTAQMAYDLNFAGAPVFFSWPSDGSAFSYVRDETVVRLSGRHLLGFLKDVVARSGAKRINLIAHSMGNRAMLDALELLAAERRGAGQHGPLFDQIIFAAPDEDAALFATMLTEIRPLAERLTLYGSDNDVALNVSERVHGDLRRAGQGGKRIVVSAAVDSIDMSALGDDVLAHGYFAKTSSALTDMRTLFWNDVPPVDRCGMSPRNQPDGRAWAFDPHSCDGPTVIAALTMLNKEGTAALSTLDRLITSGGDSIVTSSRVLEWYAIRKEVAKLTAKAMP